MSKPIPPRSRSSTLLWVGVVIVAVLMGSLAVVILGSQWKVRRLDARFATVEIGMTREQMLAIMDTPPASTSAAPQVERGGYEGLEGKSVTAVLYVVPVFLNCQNYEFVIDENDIVIDKATFD